MITEALIFKAIVTTQEFDFSFWALFARATLTVKIVILMLIGASFWAWAIIIQRHLVFNSARRDAARFDRAFWSGEPLDELYQQLGQTPRGRAARPSAATRRTDASGVARCSLLLRWHDVGRAVELGSDRISQRADLWH